MQITIKFSVPEYTAMFRAWTTTKKALKPVLVVGTGVLIAGWSLAGLDALWYLADGRGADWLIVWTLVTGAWGGLLCWVDSQRDA